MVFLHGGGWRLGSRRGAGPAYAGASPNPFELVAQSGIAVASVDYRLSGEAVFPAQLHDAKAAVRWLRARAGELGVDPDRIAAWGESAGGHLAELLGFTAGNAALEGTVGVTGVECGGRGGRLVRDPPISRPSPPTPAPTRWTRPPGRRSCWVRPPPTRPELAAQASPISHVCPAAPPTLLLHGRADRLVPCRQSERLHAALVAAGADAELHLYDDADHMWLGSAEAASDAVRRTIDFLHRRLDGDT